MGLGGHGFCHMLRNLDMVQHVVLALGHAGQGLAGR